MCGINHGAAARAALGSTISAKAASDCSLFCCLANSRIGIDGSVAFPHGYKLLMKTPKAIRNDSSPSWGAMKIQLMQILYDYCISSHQVENRTYLIQLLPALISLHDFTQSYLRATIDTVLWFRTRLFIGAFNYKFAFAFAKW